MVPRIKVKGWAVYAMPVLIPVVLSGCGGSDKDEAETAMVSLSGSPVKGPLARATVSAYLIDPSQPAMLGELVGEGETDEAAQITGLSIPQNETSPVILEVIANDDTVDISTGEAPVITSMSTILATPGGGNNVYPSPLTTIALSLAKQNADLSTNGFGGNGDGSVTAEELVAAFEVASQQVLSTLGFGIDSSIDLNSTSPVLDDTTADASSQTLAIAYRTAIEAVSAIVVNMQADAQANNAASVLTTNQVLDGLAADLSDGEIDGLAAGAAIDAFTDIADVVAEVTVDIGALTIPGTSVLVTQTATVMTQETATTGSTVDTSAIESGDVSYTPRTNASTTVTESDTDADGVVDSQDNCPVIANADQLDTDADGSGNQCDTDDDNDGVRDAEDAFPLDPSESADADNDGTGNNADTDDDNDGVEDSQDAFPFDASETLDTDGDGIGNNADNDDDDDNVIDADDLFPLDPAESEDADGDGIGNNGDTDDDNDGVEDASDNCPLVANAEQGDADGDGVGDACTQAIWDQFNWDAGLWQ
ncbi:thrombospondin type 3 repeat-containing protein [Alteromonas lipolytica]|uniref:thrombospondin type 3 repeat-containing protein n=1 Tax=Alteromonas lipolytica TaxID=1856405 RepID=UPI000B2514FE|nr:thrombospondin type 3 repeat-containing protein [Alteromonas lipolytica]GGF74004.1 hypothetical protein GCM10011338_27530 [Alteromonas lipolytica]